MPATRPTARRAKGTHECWVKGCSFHSSTPIKSGWGTRWGVPHTLGRPQDPGSIGSRCGQSFPSASSPSYHQLQTPRPTVWRHCRHFPMLLRIVISTSKELGRPACSHLYLNARGRPSAGRHPPTRHHAGSSPAQLAGTHKASCSLRHLHQTASFCTCP